MVRLPLGSVLSTFWAVEPSILPPSISRWVPTQEWSRSAGSQYVFWWKGTIGGPVGLVGSGLPVVGSASALGWPWRWSWPK